MNRLAHSLLSITLGFAFSGAACAQSPAAPAPDRIAVGPYQVQMQVIGSGRYTVIFESGFGTGMGTWRKVVPEIAKSARTVAYARAGYGQSDPRPEPRTLQESSLELDQLVAVAKLEPPFILVGHSYGGLLARAFALRHPRWVAGMVLVDPSDERLTPALRQLDPQRAAEDDKLFARIMPPRFKPEFEAIQPLLNGAFPIPGRLPDVPVVVLTSVRHEQKPMFYVEGPQAVAIKRHLHADFLRQFSDGSQVVTAASGHNIQEDEPQLVIAAVNKVIAAANGRAAQASR